MPSKRKQQTRLSFSPLPSSSPAAKSYNKQIRDRAAAVTIEGSPSPAKRRKLNSSRLDDVDELAPEAAADEAPDESDEDDPIQSSQRRSTSSRVKSRSRQQRLNFTNPPNLSSFGPPIRLPSSARRKSKRGGTMFPSQVQGRMVEVSSDESDFALPSAKKLMKKADPKAQESEVQEDSEEDDIVAPTRRSQKSKEGRKTRSSRTDLIVDSDDEGIITKAPRSVPQEESDHDEDMPTTVGTQRRNRNRRRASVDEFVVDDCPPAEDSDDEIVEVSRQSKKRRRSASSENSGEITLKTPRRLKHSRKTKQQEKEDLAEDLEFLGPSSDLDSSSRPPRSTQSAQKNARQQALEQLKRKRNASLAQVEEEQADNEAQGDAGEDSNTQDVIEIDDGEEEEEESEGEVPQFVSSRQMFKADAEDEDFLAEEDEEGVLGAPDNIPIEFTRYASMKPKELFEFAVEWMVQKKINPAFQRDDPLYQLTFRKLDDEVRGLAASKFTSSAWTPTFTGALNARPDMHFEQIDRGSAEHYLRDKCDACNRTGHPATWEIRFIGKPYSRETLEDIDNGEDDEDDDDDDDNSSDSQAEGGTADYDANGVEVAPADTVFYVGKFCHANSLTAHSLQHWKYHLNLYVEVWLDRQGYGRAEELHRRDKWSTKKRRKYANKILDRMKEEGEVKNLWKKFRDTVEEARSSKQGRFEALSP